MLRGVRRLSKMYTYLLVTFSSTQNDESLDRKCWKFIVEKEPPEEDVILNSEVINTLFSSLCLLVVSIFNLHNFTPFLVISSHIRIYSVLQAINWTKTIYVDIKMNFHALSELACRPSRRQQRIKKLIRKENTKKQQHETRNISTFMFQVHHHHFPLQSFQICSHTSLHVDSDFWISHTKKTSKIRLLRALYPRWRENFLLRLSGEMRCEISQRSNERPRSRWTDGWCVAGEFIVYEN